MKDVFRSGALVEHHSDTTRTVTTYDETGAVTSTRPYTEAENATADAAMADAARLDDLAARVARIEAHLWPADPDSEPDAPIDAPTWGDYGGIWPNGQLLSDGGTTWRNVSGVPLTTPPSGFPGVASQWDHLFVAVTTADPEPDEPEGYVGPWSELAHYTVGDIVSHNGRYWKCEIAHGPEQQGQWAPGAAHTVWTDIGPA